eukprot:scaffold472816_cov37-Prasinocladus_malaysianus.AAC.1
MQPSEGAARALARFDISYEYGNSVTSYQHEYKHGYCSAKANRSAAILPDRRDCLPGGVYRELALSLLL